jgi:hypothetical protein
MGPVKPLYVHLGAHRTGTSSFQMILSEENIAGRMAHFAAGQFYPAAEARLKTLGAAAGAPVLRTVLVARAYTELYTSAWRKRAEDNAADPFVEGRRNMLEMAEAWPGLVRQIFRHLRVQELVVLDYPRRGRSVDMLGLLVPDLAPNLAPVALREPVRRINHSATDAALIELQLR